MATLVLSLFRLLRLLGSWHEAIAAENAALRLQLAAYQRKRTRPKLTAFDRLFWCALSCEPTWWAPRIYGTDVQLSATDHPLSSKRERRSLAVRRFG